VLLSSELASRPVVRVNLCVAIFDLIWPLAPVAPLLFECSGRVESFLLARCAFSRPLATNTHKSVCLAPHSHSRSHSHRDTSPVSGYSPLAATKCKRTQITNQLPGAAAAVLTSAYFWE